MKRVNIQLTRSEHTNAKIIAVLQGMTLNDYLAQAVAEQLRKDAKILKKIGDC